MDHFDASSVEEFRNVIFSAEELYKQCKYELENCEKKQQDILHELELVNLSYHERGKLAKELVLTRRRRREFKNQIFLLEPFMTWKEANKKAINDISSVLGQTRKVEERQKSMVYHKKTDDSIIIGKNDQ